MTYENFMKTNENAIKRTAQEICRKMDGNRHITVILKNGIEVIISRNSDGYTLYDGCELIVGDTNTIKIASNLIYMNTKEYLRERPSYL